MYFEIRFQLVIASEAKQEAISIIVGDCFGLTSFGLAMTANLDSNDVGGNFNATCVLCRAAAELIAKDHISTGGYGYLLLRNAKAKE